MKFGNRLYAAIMGCDMIVHVLYLSLKASTEACTTHINAREPSCQQLCLLHVLQNFAHEAVQQALIFVLISTHLWQ